MGSDPFTLVRGGSAIGTTPDSATSAESTPPPTTTARHETRCDASTVAVGIAIPPSPTMMAMPFMRRPRSSAKSSEDSAFDAVLMLADARPSANRADAASTAFDAVANNGRHSCNEGRRNN